MEASSKIILYNQQFSDLMALSDFLASHFFDLKNDFKELENYVLSDSKLSNLYLLLTKDFKILNNKITIAIYLIDYKKRIVTEEHLFTSLIDIINLSKAHFPDTIGDIDLLLQDKVLSSIMYHEFTLTQDLKYKRMYLFCKNLEDNYDLGFIYYYMIFMNLDAEEAVSFTLLGQKRYDIKEIKALLTKEDYLVVLQEIKNSPIILALLATKIGVNDLKEYITNYDIYGILYLLNGLFNDLEHLIKDDFAFYLLNNINNYTFVTDSALKLKSKLEAIILSEDTKFIDYIRLVPEVNMLYNAFLKLFTRNLLLNYQVEIKANQTDDYLMYKYQGKYVSARYLKAINKNISIDLGLANEKEYLLNCLNQVNNEAKEFANKLKEKQAKYKAINSFKTVACFLVSSLIFLACFRIVFKEKMLINAIFIYLGLAGSFISMVYYMLASLNYAKHISVKKWYANFSLNLNEEKNLVSSIVMHEKKPLNTTVILKAKLRNEPIFLGLNKALAKCKNPQFNRNMIIACGILSYYALFIFMVNWADVRYILPGFSIIGLALAFFNIFVILIRQKAFLFSYYVLSLIYVIIIIVYGGLI